MQMDDVAAMEVLKEIKDLMDSRLGDKMKAPDDAKGVEVSSVKLLDGGDEGPEKAGMPEGAPVDDGDEMDPMDMEELKKVRHSMMG